MDIHLARESLRNDGDGVATINNQAGHLSLFQVGSKVKCRVLHVHLKRRQLTLTAKKSLVQSDFQLTNTADAKVNMLLTGYISKMIDAGAIVQFYGGARGWMTGSVGG